MGFSFFKWSSRANTTNLNIFASTSTVRCRWVLYRGNLASPCLGLAKQTSRQAYHERSAFRQQHEEYFPSRAEWLLTGGCRFGKTPQGSGQAKHGVENCSALYRSRFPGTGSHVWLSLVNNETSARTVQRMYLSQVGQAWRDPRNNPNLTRNELEFFQDPLMLEMLACHRKDARSRSVVCNPYVWGLFLLIKDRNAVFTSQKMK